MLRQTLFASVAAFAVAGGSPVHAQAEGASGYKILGDDYVTTDFFDSFRGGCRGQFSNDSHLDTVLLLFNDQNEAEAYAFWGNGVFEAVSIMDDGAGFPLSKACATIPQLNPGRDGIVTSHADGLRIVRYDHAAWGFECDMLVASPFLEGDLIRCGDLGGGSAPDLLVRVPVGQEHELWVVEDVVAQPVMPLVVSHGTVRQIEVSGVVNDVVVLNFDGWGEDEIAVNTSTMGTCVLDSDGTSVAGPYPYWQAGDKLAALPTPMITAERLLVVGKNVQGQILFTTHSPTQSSSPMVFGQAGFIGIDVGDWDCDGRVDVVVSTDVAWTVHVFLQQDSATNPFSLSERVDLDYEDILDIEILADPGINDAVPVVGDFDRDGDVDVTIGVDFLEAALYLRNGTEKHRDMTADVYDLNAVVSGPDDIVGVYEYEFTENPPNGPHNGDGSLSFALAKPIEWPSNIPTDWASSRVEIIIWRMPDAASGADPQAVARKKYDWKQGWSSGPWCIFQVEPVQDESNAPLAIPDHDLTTPELFSCEIRLVEVDSQARGTALDWGPSSFLFLSGKTTEREYLVNEEELGVDLDDVFGLTLDDTPDDGDYGLNTAMEVIRIGCCWLNDPAPPSPVPQ